MTVALAKQIHFALPGLVLMQNKQLVCHPGKLCKIRKLWECPILCSLRFVNLPMQTGICHHLLINILSLTLSPLSLFSISYCLFFIFTLSENNSQRLYSAPGGLTRVDQTIICSMMAAAHGDTFFGKTSPCLSVLGRVNEVKHYLSLVP